jgi:hypothetical protein
VPSLPFLDLGERIGPQYSNYRTPMRPKGIFSYGPGVVITGLFRRR